MVRASMVPMLLVCCGLAAQTPAPAPAPATRLSLRDALQTALKNNLQVEISQQAREFTRAGVLASEGPFDWNLSASLQAAQLKSATNATFSNGTLVPDTSSTVTQRGFVGDLNRNFEWGGNLDLNYAPAYRYAEGFYRGANLAPEFTPFSTANPYNGAFTAKYSQSFLQGFGLEVTTAPMVIARKKADAADFTFQLAMITLAANTEAQYWAVVYDQKNLANEQTSLQLAQKQLDENNIRLKVGTMAPLDVVSAEAQVAKAEQAIISAQAQLDNDREALANGLYPNGDRPAGLELTDEPTLGHIQLTEAEAVDRALKNRLELKASKITTDIDQLNLTVSQDKLRPQLNGFVSYNGGTDTYSSLGPVNSDLGGLKYPGYTVGVSLAMPLQNRTAKGNLAAARATLRGDELTLKNQELGIVLEVRTAIRNIDATEKGVKAAEKTRYLQERTLDAEQKKFENGMSTNLNVLQIMSNLDAARSAETQAQIAYASAVTALEKAVGNLLQARDFVVQ